MCGQNAPMLCALTDCCALVLRICRLGVLAETCLCSAVGIHIAKGQSRVLSRQRTHRHLGRSFAGQGFARAPASSPGAMYSCLKLGVAMSRCTVMCKPVADNRSWCARLRSMAPGHGCPEPVARDIHRLVKSPQPKPKTCVR